MAIPGSDTRRRSRFALILDQIKLAVTSVFKVE